MGGINNVQAGNIPMNNYQAAALDAPAPATPGAAAPQGTGALADANQTKGGQSVLKAAAVSENDVSAYIGADLTFQDKTPRNGGSSVTTGGFGGGSQAQDLVSAYAAADLTKGQQQTNWVAAAIEPLQAFVGGIVRDLIGQDKTFSSWGDPHEKTGDGLQLDNQLTGRFVAFKSDEGDLELQKDQGPDQSGRWPGMTLNHAVAMKVGQNRISFDLAQPDSLTVNGQRVPWKDGATTMPDGTVLQIEGKNLSVFSTRGDVVTIKREGSDSYLNIEGKISGMRPRGSVQGSLGNFDGDGNANNDLVARGGAAVPVEAGKGRNSWEQIVYTPQIDAFLKSWLLKPGESLF